MSWMRLGLAASALLALVLLPAAPVGAQQTDEERSVRVQFEVGDFDGDEGDWPITVVYVTGDLDDGEPFTIELLAADATVLWSGTEAFTAPTSAVAVDRFLAVGDVTDAAISQALPEVAGDVVTRPEVEVLQQGSGGGGGSGQLALSMVVAVIFVAILFRTPLPSASTQRWTK